MYINQLRNLIGTLLVLGQAAVLFYIFFLVRTTLFMHEAVALAGLIAPLFSVFLIAITRNFLKERKSAAKGRRVGYPFIFISLFYPVIFLTSLFLIIYLYHNRTIETIDSLKKIISIIETSFGIYLGLVIDKIFPRTT